MDDEAERRPDAPGTVPEPKPDQTATTAAAPDTKPKRKRASSFPWLLSGVLLVFVAAGAAYLTWPIWKYQLPSFARVLLEPVMQAGRDIGLRTHVEAIDKRLAGVESQIKLMREAMAKSSASGNAAAAGRARLDAVEKAVADLTRANAGGARLAQRLGRLQAAVAELRAGGSGGGAASAALVRGLRALDRRVTALAARVGADRANRANRANQGDPAAVGALRAENDEKFTALRRDNQALTSAVAALTRRLAALEARPAAPAVVQRPAGDSGLLLAVGQLRDALRGSGPFADELGAVRTIGAGDAAVEKAFTALSRHAARGIKGRAALGEGFRTTVVAVARAALAPQGGGWLDQTLARLSRVITVRRASDGAVDPSSATGLLAQAEGRMSAGDLAGAVAALDRLEGAAAKAAAGWLRDAHRRLDAEKALAALTARAIARLDASRARRGGGAAGG